MNKSYIMKTKKLIYKEIEILSKIRYVTSILGISYGLMFASKKKIDQGICLVMPTNRKSRLSCSVTMLFCFHPMNILFLNEKYKVVDKVVLKPFQLSYVPKKPAKYIIECHKHKFKYLRIGNVLKIESDYIKFKQFIYSLIFKFYT